MKEEKSETSADFQIESPRKYADVFSRRARMQKRISPGNSTVMLTTAGTQIVQNSREIMITDTIESTKKKNGTISSAREHGHKSRTLFS